MRSRVVVLDYGSGNLRSVVRAVERAGADVELTGDFDAALAADGLVVPGVGAFAACMAGLREVGGDRIIGRRLAGGRPVLGICVGMQVLFEHGVEHGVETEGCGEWPGTVARLQADVVPHMGWNTVDGAVRVGAVRRDRAGALLLRALLRRPHLGPRDHRPHPRRPWSPGPSTAATGSSPRWRTVRSTATQFHPEKSGDAGAALLRNWVGSLCGGRGACPPAGRARAAAAEVAAERAAEAEKAARRRQRRDRLTGWLPRPAAGQSGTLAARRRRAAGWCWRSCSPSTCSFWLAATGWAARALVLLLSLLATPIVLHLMSRKSPMPDVETYLQLLPAVDITEGRAVQLAQGVAGSERVYGDPVAAARRWQDAGAEWLHLVDLDAAFGRGTQPRAPGRDRRPRSTSTSR